jgi:hypothetical protein
MENRLAMSGSGEDIMLDYYLLMAKLSKALSVASATVFELMECKDCQQTVDHATGVRNVLETMKIVPSVFKVLTNFTTTEFEEISSIVCPIIVSHARSTGEIIRGAGRPPKLSPQQRLLAFLLYLKHDNTTIFEAFQWNWAKSSVCDDAVFIASCIDYACDGELAWPDAEKRSRLSRQIPEFPGCIGFIDGTLCKIKKPGGENANHKQYYNGRKSIYCMNNIVVVDHQGLFIYIDPGYPGTFHDVNCLRHSDISQNWQNYFTITDDYQEYLLGDPGYMGEDAFIMRRVDRREIPDDADQNELSAIDAYNKMHAGYRIQVEWGIGGMKRKFKRMMKGFDASKEKFPIMFRAAAILTNFIHRRRLDFSADVGEYQADDGDNFGWEGDY